MLEKKILLIMETAGLGLFGWGVKKRFGKEFLGFTTIFVLAVIFGVSIDVFSRLINDGRLFFSMWLSPFLGATYSDELNMVVSTVLGTLAVSGFAYIRLVKKRKTTIDEKPYILLGSEKEIKVERIFYNFMHVWRKVSGRKYRCC